MSNKILVVDDELSFREPISNFLKVSGYKTLTASSGEKALEIMKTFLPDLVLTDIKMPGMDGLTFSKNIKTKHPAIEVILMTAFGNIEGAVKAMQDGAFDYVSKPFFFEDLLLHVTAVFEKIELKQKLYEYKLYATTAHNTKILKLIASNICHRFNNLLMPISITPELWSRLIVSLSTLKKSATCEDMKTINNFEIEGNNLINSELKVLSKAKEIMELWKNLSSANPDEIHHFLSLKQCIKAALDITQQERYTYFSEDALEGFNKDIPGISGTFNEITRLHINLILNAVDALKKSSLNNSKFRSQISVCVSYDQNSVFSRVTDNGIGMEKRLIEQIEELFSTYKRTFPISKGGLYDSLGIANNYGA